MLEGLAKNEGGGLGHFAGLREGLAKTSGGCF